LSWEKSEQVSGQYGKLGLGKPAKGLHGQKSTRKDQDHNHRGKSDHQATHRKEGTIAYHNANEKEYPAPNTKRKDCGTCRGFFAEIKEGGGTFRWRVRNKNELMDLLWNTLARTKLTRAQRGTTQNLGKL